MCNIYCWQAKVKGTAILPLLVGNLTADMDEYTHYFNSKCEPLLPDFRKFPDIKVNEVEKKFKEYVADLKSVLQIQDDLSDLVRFGPTVQAVRGWGSEFTEFAFV